MSEPERGPKKIGALLHQVLQRRGMNQLTARLELEDVWKRIADPPLLAYAKLGSLRRGVLEILVANGVLLQELESFRKQELLDKLRQHTQFSSIKSLKFRRG